MKPSNGEETETPEDDTGSFQFNPQLKTSEREGISTSMKDISEIQEKHQKRLLDIVRLEPTSNSDLQDCWNFESGSQVHEYLESELKPYYYRDDDSCICVTQEAKDFIRGNSGPYQNVTEQPDNSESVEENIRNRDLLMDLVAVTQRVGHLPDSEEINRHSEYSPDQFREEFGNLFQACQEAGFIPDSVTQSDYKEAIESRDHEGPEAEGESETEEEPEPSQNSPSQEETEQPPDSPSCEELIEELQWVDETMNRIPYPSDMNDEGAFRSHIYQDKFGSWDEALEAAGIDKEQELLKDIQTVADKTGEDMTQSEMNEHGLYSSTMAARYFGSWSDAKDRFKEWNSDHPEEEESDEEFDKMVDDRLDDLLG